MCQELERIPATQCLVVELFLAGTRMLEMRI